MRVHAGQRFAKRMLKIKVKELTACGVQPGGETLELGLIDTAGAPVALQMPFDHAQSLLMTLPGLLTNALRDMTGVPQSRYVFPLGTWCLESTPDKTCVIATFATEDGFEVSFGIPSEACQGLGWALKHEAAGPAEPEATEDALGERARLN